MDLAKLRRIVDALIEEEREDAPVAAFIISAKDVRETTDFLKSAGKINPDSSPNVRDVLTELLTNAGNPPFEDRILETLEDLLIHWDDAED